MGVLREVVKLLRAVAAEEAEGSLRRVGMVRVETVYETPYTVTGLLAQLIRLEISASSCACARQRRGLERAVQPQR